MIDYYIYNQKKYLQMIRNKACFSWEKEREKERTRERGEGERVPNQQ